MSGEYLLPRRPGVPMVNRRLVRFGAIAVLPLLALTLSSCVGGLPVTVTSVSGILEPTNPGPPGPTQPAERVEFTVSAYTYGSPNPLLCLIDVYHNGTMVGTTLATIGSEAGTATARGFQVSDPVEVNLPSPFDGTPSDATVSCTAKV
jgi:hypothetical protein